MRKELLLAAGIGLQACAPLDYSDLPNADESETIYGRTDQISLVVPYVADLARASKVPLVDKYGNKDESSNEQVALDILEKHELLIWMRDNNRIRVYDKKDYDGRADKPPAGMYDGNPGQAQKNDWLYVAREHLAHIGVYPHEMGHLFFSGPKLGHTKKVYDELLAMADEQAEVANGVFLEFGIEEGDPCVQDEHLTEEGWSFFWDINPVTEMERIREGVIEDVDRGRITPQQGYDQLYKKYQGGMEFFYSDTIKEAMYDDQGNYTEHFGLWPLSMNDNDILETTINSARMKEWYQYISNYILDEYCLEFPESDIEIKHEPIETDDTGSETEDTGDFEDTSDYSELERRTTDLDGYTINNKRLR